MDIVDKRVVVTGAASGIGKALAVEFKNEKAKDVVLADLNEDVLKVAEELGFSGFVLNVGKEAEVKNLISFLFIYKILFFWLNLLFIQKDIY